MRLATLATCALNQWAMDFEGNTNRIIASIREAKARGASYRIGPELEITGYGCEDHFLEHDTCQHAYATLSIPLTESRHPCPPCHVASNPAAITASSATARMLCNIGLPVDSTWRAYNLNSQLTPFPCCLLGIWECLAAIIVSGATAGILCDIGLPEEHRGCLAAIIASGATASILCDIGLPVEHRGVHYNCRAFVHSRRILLLRPKMDLANDGNYRETRWFATWKRLGVVESVRLPAVVTAACEGQREVPIGDGVLDLLDRGGETCEELFTPLAPHIRAALAGAEVVGNGSGSHHELRKLGTRVGLVQSATSKAGGVYLYANQKGCDGGRLYYDGCAMVVVNGQVVAQGSQFSLADVEVVTATVDLDQEGGGKGEHGRMSLGGSVGAMGAGGGLEDEEGVGAGREDEEEMEEQIVEEVYEEGDWARGEEEDVMAEGGSGGGWEGDWASEEEDVMEGVVVPEGDEEGEGAGGEEEGVVEGAVVASYRGAISSLREQASASAPAPSASFPTLSSSASSSPGIVRIPSDISICHPSSASLTLATSHPIQIRYHCPEEEIALGPACWLWDYLRRSGASGFLLPLSGGADSSSVAAIVGCMCQLVAKDYFRRSGASGFLLPLSGGADSSSVAAIVGCMCQPVVKGHPWSHSKAHVPAGDDRQEGEAHVPAGDDRQEGETSIAEGDEQVQQDAERIMGLQLAAGAAAEEQKRQAARLADRILNTIYMGTENSSQATRSRAKKLASEIGAWHLDTSIDSVVAAVVALFLTVTGLRPRYKLDGGTSAENLALQNIQARLRMVLAFLFAQLLPWVRGHGRGGGGGGEQAGEKGKEEGRKEGTADGQQRGGEGGGRGGGEEKVPVVGVLERSKGRGGGSEQRGGGGGFLLVLGSANVDEALRGYLTKYDCSSADINPIGGISKTDLRRFLRWAAVHLGFASLADVEAAPPTAELEPIRADYVQVDEVDMGMTYEELSLYGRLRKVLRCGPVAMFQHLCHEWRQRLTVAEVAGKVKAFFRFYSINRHKMTTLTPSYHAENYSPEDNRFDLRQFLYNVAWPWQFKQIDQLVAEHEAAAGAGAATLSSEGSNAAGAAM
ncbi:unnamed protein product [Closterium sp. NIES-64]|nr:unnamed protein product [Closterium sp. NIES-64]